MTGIKWGHHVRGRDSDLGFTLVELIVAITIAAVLTAVAIVGIRGLTSSGNKSQCSSLLSAAQSAATTYYANTGAYPKTSGAAPIGFSALTTGSPPVLSLPSGVTASGNVLSATTWSITMAGGGSFTPNTYAKTSGGVACS